MARLSSAHERTANGTRDTADGPNPALPLVPAEPTGNSFGQLCAQWVVIPHRLQECALVPFRWWISHIAPSPTLNRLQTSALVSIRASKTFFLPPLCVPNAPPANTMHDVGDPSGRVSRLHVDGEWWSTSIGNPQT